MTLTEKHHGRRPLLSLKHLYWSAGPELREWWFALVCCLPGRIGMRFRSSFCKRRLRSCGRAPTVQQHVYLLHPERISVGDHWVVNRFVQIEGAGGVTIGNHVMIGPAVLIWSINRCFDDPSRPMREQGYWLDPIVIGDDVWIGAGAGVLPGSHIGSGTVIAAGSVVRGRVPSRVIAAGVPAVVKRDR